ncbi:MAG: ATP-binding protein [Acidimicrobiia bacterium]
MDLSSGRLPTGTVTFLFSDIEDSTSLVEELTTSTYRDLIEQHHRLLRTAFTHHGGIERGTQGDGFLVVFPEAPTAVAAAVDAQRSLVTATWPSGVEVRVRMGLHSGVGVHGGDDYVGRDINLAARIGEAAHGGQVLISESTRALAERTLPDGVGVRYVGQHRLKGLEHPERLYQLLIDGLPETFPPLRSVDAGVAHLPVRATSFVGRRAEMGQLGALLEQSSLITLVGPGGSGKTSLATELARKAADEFGDGAWFVDLAALDGPTLVEPAIARSLGLREQSRRPTIDVLTDHLATRDLLLLLDNFEHVLPAADVVATLLTAAPKLKILVTSRIRLNLYGEQEFPVPPLGLQDTDHVVDIGELAKGEAVSLFVERARTVQPDFSITDENAQVIVQICERLDGLPLAIELAASRIRLLTPDEILERLEQRLPVLDIAATESNRPERHQTLQKTIGWSYEMMRPVEQDLFTRLSVFVGGFTLAAAEAIANPDGELGIDTLGGIASLRDHSLIRQRSVRGTSRFDMLETIHGFARNLLASDTALEKIPIRHLRYYRDMAEHAEPHLMGPRQLEWLDRLDIEHANLREALRTALDSANIEDGLRLASSVWRFWFERGYLREGRRWLEKVLGLEPATVSAARAKGYTALGGLTYWLADPDATDQAYQAALSIYRQIGDEEAEAEAMYNLTFVAAMNNDPQEARRRGEASMAGARRIGSPSLVARNQIVLGLAAMFDGNPRSAVSYFEEALEVFRESGDTFHITWAVGSLGQAYFELGELDKGRAAFLEALRLSASVGSLPVIGAGLRALSMQESSQGNHLEAVRLAGAAESLEEATGAASPLPLIVNADLNAAREALGDGVVEVALAEGRRMTPQESVDYATSLVE